MHRTKFILCLVSILLLTVGCTNTLAPPLEITEEALEGSSEIISTNPEIDDAEIMVEDGLLKFFIVPEEGQEISQERLRQLGEDYVRLLGGYAAGDEVTGPTEESYGGIYDFYDVEIIIEGERGTFLDRGTKAKGENEIQWGQ